MRQRHSPTLIGLEPTRVSPIANDSAIDQSMTSEQCFNSMKLAKTCKTEPTIIFKICPGRRRPNRPLIAMLASCTRLQKYFLTLSMWAETFVGI